MTQKKLPIGIENFREFFTDDYYYVDKTGFIIELLHNVGKVNLFTRPRRFGKSLNMSMLKTFFEIGCDQTLFDGLKVSREPKLCKQYMGRFPVISITLKGVDGLTFVQARNALSSLIGDEAMRFQCLKKSPKLTDEEKERYAKLIRLTSSKNITRETPMYDMSDNLLVSSLKILSELLEKHYDNKVVFLIDEYDVPLDKAFQAGYYDEMVSLIRNLLGNALKTNDSLQFAVLTGCLRISKESIFTGLNNLKIHTITDHRYDEWFGFTDDEVQRLLASYGVSEHYDTVKAWYDGYRFGNRNVYCPWDVINYCDEVRQNSKMWPKNYWINTSGNGMIRRFIDKADQRTRNDIEELIAGNGVVKKINETLTYSELDDSIDNLWSVLFTTGYLTAIEYMPDNLYRLKIPNKEIRQLFIEKIKEWFKEKTFSEPSRLEAFCEAVILGDAEKVEEQLNRYLRQTISLRDETVRKVRKENFYQGILLGLLSYPNDWMVKSNAESGDGYSDIRIMDYERSTGVIIEVKYAEKGALDAACAEALKQIGEMHYDEELCDEGMETIMRYGIAFYKKRCRVVFSKEKTQL
jgi:hypothetical protein